MILAVHSSREIDLERIKIPMRIQREFLIKLCLFCGERVQTPNKKQCDVNDEVTIYELKRYWDGLILLVENRNTKKNVHFSFHCSLSQNAFMSRKDFRHRTFDVVPPMQRQIIVTVALVKTPIF